MQEILVNGFETQEQAAAYFKTEIAKWGKQWENFEITDDEYHKIALMGTKFGLASVSKNGQWTSIIINKEIIIFDLRTGYKDLFFFFVKRRKI